MKRVLVTGANGFIGRHTLDSLSQRGYEVHAMSRQPQAIGPNTHWHELDLFDATGIKRLIGDTGATHLLHLAWVTDPASYRDSPENTSWLEASTILLDEFRRQGGQRAVIVGTCAEYDWTGGHCVEDETPCRAQSPYTTAKLALRKHAATLADDVSLAWARVFFTFGPHEPKARLVPSIVLPLLSGDRAACSDGEQVRDFMYVADMADAMVAVLDHEFRGDINIASGREITLKDLITRIGNKLGALDRIDFGERERRPGEPARITADTRRLNDTVAWQPRHTLDAALDETIAWWRTVTN